MKKRKNPTERQRWLPYVRRIADLMMLKDWRIEISEEPPAASDACASCDPVQGRKMATLRLSSGFLEDPPDDQRQTVVHELIHCHLGHSWRLLEANDHMSNGSKMALEYAVDGLADAFAPFLPMPPASTRSQH
jgi:hypothetical protein